MKRILYIVFLLFSYYSRAQNLVPNPSFEDYVACPGGAGGPGLPSMPFVSVSGWYKPTAAGTSDYMNACAGAASAVSVPDNLPGPQEARTGNAYTGIHAYSSLGESVTYREYLTGKLQSTLAPGHRYYTSYWVSLGEWNNVMQIGGVDQMGVLFTNDSIEDLVNIEIFDVPQVISPVGDAYTDTANWAQVRGIFTAAGGERWITIGNFIPGTDLIPEPFGEYLWGYFCYYFIEDVCVLDLDRPGESSVTDTIICLGEEIAIGAAGENMDVLEWNDGYTGRIRPVSDSGIYWLKSVNLATCTLATDTIRIGISPKAQPVDLGSDTFVCAGQPLTLSAPDTGYETYSWSTGSQAPSILVTAAGTYSVAATSYCSYSTDTIVVTVPEMPNAALPADTILCNGTLVWLGNDQPGMYYLWNTGSMACCMGISESGTYVLTVSDQCGNTDADSINIRYSGCDNCLIEPTAFSPNNDGLNDRFILIANCEMAVYRLTIFNRWGQLVFFTSDVNEGWDGTVNGQPADVGTYFYQVDAIPATKETGKISRRGNITLLR